MSKFGFKSGGKFVLDDGVNYYASFIKAEEFVSKKNSDHQGINFFFEIIQNTELEEGEGTSRGKVLKKLFWANGVDEDENLTFPESGKYRACVEALAEYLGLDIDEIDDTDELVGGVVLSSIVNDSTDDVTYSNIDTVKQVSDKKKDKVKELEKTWKKWKKEQEDDDDDTPKRKKKPFKDVEKKEKKKDDDNDDFDEDDDDDKKEDKKEEKKEKKKKVPEKKTKPSEDDDDDDDDDGFFNDD